MLKRCLGFYLLFVLFASSVFAAVEDIKVSGEIVSGAEVRDVSLGLRGKHWTGVGDTSSGDRYLFGQTRIRFDSDLTEDVSAVVSFVNERVWGASTSSSGTTGLQVDNSYVDIKEFLGMPIHLRLGRQDLHFGNGFLIGNSTTNTHTISSSGFYHVADNLSMMKAFDAIRMTLDLDQWSIDFIYSKINEGSISVREDKNLWGFNANFSSDEKSEYEAYFWTKEKNEIATTGALTTDDQNKTYVAGLHTKHELGEHLTFNMEGAHQFGDYIDGMGLHARRDAWAAQIGTDYKFLNKSYSILGLWYTYLSADAQPYAKAGESAGGLYTKWDPFFEDQTGGEIINMILPHANAHTVVLYYFQYLKENLNVCLKYTHQRLSKNHYADRYPITEGPAYGNYYYIEGNKHLGDELDFKFVYDYSEDMQFMFEGGALLPGGLLAQENSNTAYFLRWTAKLSF